jgi:anti-sigma regulatory factor (Ser/Thr protein kinase)
MYVPSAHRGHVCQAAQPFALQRLVVPFLLPGRAGCQHAGTKGPHEMTTAARESTSLVAFTLPSTPYSAQMARFYVRAALTYHQLSEYAEDGVTIASELVTNAIQHSGAMQVGLEVCHLPDSDAVAVIVADTSLSPPVRRDLSEGAEHGRGLNIVDALSVSWGWQLQAHGKTVYAILSREG